MPRLVHLGLLLAVCLLAGSVAANGVVTVSGPTSFLRSQSATFTVTLNPVPTAPTEITISTTARAIASSSHNTLSFSPGQGSLTFSLISLPNGRIGTVTIILTPADLLAYDEMSFDATVQGTISLKVLSSCSGIGLSTSIEATIDPPASGDRFISALSSTSGTSSVFFNSGQRTSVTSFNEVAVGSVTVTFSHALYASNTVTYQVINSFSSTLPDRVTSTEIQFTIASSVPTFLTRATITGNIPELPTTTLISPTTGLNLVTKARLARGTATFTITAPGFCPFTDSAVVEPKITCNTGFAPDFSDSVCLECPGRNSSLGACFNRGSCIYSNCNNDQRVRCNCVSGFTGETCQWDANSVVTRGAPGRPASAQGTLYSVNYTQPASGFATTSGNEVLALQLAEKVAGPLYTGGDPTVGVPFRATATFVGFAVSLLCQDGALIQTFPAVNFELIAAVAFLPNRPFTLTDLYYWDPIARTWKIENRCTGNISWDPKLEVNRIPFQLCNSGEYRVFIVDVDMKPPVIAGLEGRPVEITSGQTGLQPQFPPDPSFAVEEFLGEPLRLPIGSVSSASTTSAAVLLVLAAIAMML